MELILFVSLLMHVVGQTEVKGNPDAPADIEVAQFSWTHYRGAWSDETRSEKANPANQKRDFRREAENNNSVENRIRDLRELEEDVKSERMDSKPVDIYKYRVELKNRGSKVINWIFLDYQIGAPSDPDNPLHRQFACAVKIKPDEREKFEALSNSPPRRLISATDTQAHLTERLIINRVEYNDGTIWQRVGWHAPDQLPTRGSARGPCRPI